MPTSGTLAPTSTADKTIGADGFVQWTDDSSVPASFRWLVLTADNPWVTAFAGGTTQWANLLKATGAGAITVSEVIQGSGLGAIGSTWGQGSVVINVGEGTWPFLNPISGVAWTRSNLFNYFFGIRHISGSNITWTGTSFRRKWTAWQAPAITSLDISSGDIAGGTAVTISGTDFYLNTSIYVTARKVSVAFGGAAATVVSQPNGVSVNILTPAHAAGIVDVTVTATYDDGSTSTATLTSGYTYIAPPVPTEVDIIGSGGLEVSGVLASGSTSDSGVIAVSAGTPPELHGNQWGLLQFVMRSRLEERI